MTMTYKPIRFSRRQGSSGRRPAAASKNRGCGGNPTGDQEWLFEMTCAGWLRAARPKPKLPMRGSTRPGALSLARRTGRKSAGQKNAEAPRGNNAGSARAWVEPAEGAEGAAGLARLRHLSPGSLMRSVSNAKLIRRCMLAAALTALAGCSINPNTGRGQFLALPAVQAIQADINVVLRGGRCTRRVCSSLRRPGRH